MNLAFYENNQSLAPMRRQARSFTLIELLVVLALVAILSVVVILTLNPTELIKQARDSNRLSDLGTINTALNLFSADVTSGFMGTSTTVYVSIPDNASSTCGSLGLPTLPAGYTYNCVTTANLRNINGTGWVPVNFQRISSNSPISQLPIDPVNTTSSGNYYTYISGGSWELASNMESAKQKAITGASGTDGGVSLSSYEVGNNLKLIPSGILEWKRDTSLVGYWTLDEGSGSTAYDSSGNGNDGTYYGSPSWGPGKLNNSMSLDGSINKYVETPAFDFLGMSASNFTFTGWVNPNVLAGTILHNHSSNGWSTGLVGFISGKLTMEIYASPMVSSPATSNTSSWIFFALTKDSNALNSLYQDGVLAISSGFSYSPSGSPQNIGIGYFRADCCQMDSPGWFNGKIDDIRLYNRVLSAAEIKAIYDSTK